MYNTRDQFENDILQTPALYDDHTLASIEVAWNVYQAAANTNLNMLLLGRWVQPSTPQQPGIDLLAQQNFHVMDEVFTGGSIMNSANWTLLVNDAWVLGGIHAHTEFQLASPRTGDNIYDAGQHRLTVTGREIVALVSYGYTINRLPLGEVALCSDPQRADIATFADYHAAINRYTMNNVWQDLVDIAVLQ